MSQLFHVTCLRAALTNAWVIVGIGRPFLYAFSTYGQEGVEKALQILHVRLSCGDRLCAER